ncbi:hypothetical protein EN836_22710 [Mesorhizobium sp. M1C.F.Ca.ET.193.01.1.1]|nr:hypothetical protein EN853_22700 [Mesorhizobium sp. M1C.F.Ca.ET.210.01.1.1]TGQ68039.1 hypothetical protein EN855_022710 [Mesorhizobium sp. M1C.F.Ca.ET.212.01.1.1]TGR03122.1 hypothetical protein EN847_22700 [Mesorhizobium sp. M1C.F.Ca.ET.204.01.1.1]TGR23660.1 hypothetical protein EN839_22700 [Mesorhizobium sp. M1C.F.Ca.ET.196.01.1.1]TGR46532.1 hypothetical protein EN838_22700 [Mesorhizobium sp. M1C.F.Ca.ET.195.01.1.1]TGR62856.1 hypothetical protein EN835_022695 [Mesorhizobium sp. M1C.F.Ca.ET
MTGIGVPRRPALSYRTSPPLGGRLAVTRAGAHFCNVENWRDLSRRPISPLEGEMSGRTEGGATDHDARHRAKR